MPLLAKVAHEDRREIGVAPRGEHGERMADRPDDETRDPLLQLEPERGRDRSVEDGDRPGRSAQEDRLGERAMDRRLEALDMLERKGHPISAPPPKLKKERKKDEAAKAIDRPKMI